MPSRRTPPEGPQGGGLQAVTARRTGGSRSPSTQRKPGLPATGPNEFASPLLRRKWAVRQLRSPEAGRRPARRGANRIIGIGRTFGPTWRHKSTQTSSHDEIHPPPRGAHAPREPAALGHPRGRDAPPALSRHQRETGRLLLCRPALHGRRRRRLGQASDERIPKYEVGGYGFFNDTRVVYVTITPDEALQQFRYRLARAISPYCSLRDYDLDSADAFRFHATLAMKLDWLTFQRIKWYFRKQEQVTYRHHPIRATLLRNSRILCEYDFVQERMLSRSQARSRATQKRDFDILKVWGEGNGEGG